MQRNESCKIGRTEVMAIGQSSFTMISGPTQVPNARRSDVFAFNLNGCVKPLSRANTIGKTELLRRAEISDEDLLEPSRGWRSSCTHIIGEHLGQKESL